MGVNARGAGFSWLGEALMQLANQNREKKARDQYLAQQDERYRTGLEREDANLADERAWREKTRADQMALLEQQRKDAELGRNQQRFDSGYRMTAGPVAGPKGFALPSLKRDPALSVENQDAVYRAEQQRRLNPPAPREPTLAWTPTTDGRSFNRLTGEYKGTPSVKPGGPNGADANIDNALATMETLSRNPSAAGDVAFGYAFIKLLDPTSVVREGELALLSKAKGLRTAVEQQIKRAQTGESLTPAQRLDYLTKAREIVAARKQMQMGAFAPATSQLPGDEGSLSDADLWEKKRNEGMDPDDATDYVRNRAR